MTFFVDRGYDNYTYITVEFEFDPLKSQTNKQKHGIDFVDGQRLWQSPFLEIKAKSVSEARVVTIGIIDGNFWTAISTNRDVKSELSQ